MPGGVARHAMVHVLGRYCQNPQCFAVQGYTGWVVPLPYPPSRVHHPATPVIAGAGPRHRPQRLADSVKTAISGISTYHVDGGAYCSWLRSRSRSRLTP